MLPPLLESMAFVSGNEYPWLSDLPLVTRAFCSLPLCPPFTIFSEDRTRLGIVHVENFVFSLPLHSPFTIFSEDRTRLGIVNE